MDANQDGDGLRYLEPSRAEIAGDDCTGMTINTPAGQPVGVLQGFVVDPPRRRVRYLVMRPSGSPGPTALLPITAARVNAEERAIEVMDDAVLRDLRPFRATLYPAFSDDDMLAALFWRDPRARQ